MGAEGLGPALGREFGDVPVRMCGEPEEHVLQVREGWDIDQFAALDQRVEQGGAPRALHAAGEEPVLATHRDDAQLVLGSGMPPAGLCPLTRLEDRITRMWTRPIMAEAA